MGFVALSILMMQIFEWSAMLYLVLSQKNKRIEEIMFNTNHLPSELDLRQALTPGQMNYRKGEKLLKYLFILLFVVFLLTLIALAVFDIFPILA